MFRKHLAGPLLFGLTPLSKLFVFVLGTILFLVATYVVLLILCSVYGFFVALTGFFPDELTKGTLAVLVAISAIIVGTTYFIGIHFALVRPTQASSRQLGSNE